MKGRRDNSIPIGHKLEDRNGVEWVVEDIISKPDSKGIKRKLCVCRKLETDEILEKRYDTVRNWFKGRMKKNTYEIKGDVVKAYTSSGKLFTYDLEEHERVSKYNWSIDGHGYVVRNNRDIDDKDIPIRLHRFILNITDRYIHVDHHNHDKSNNLKSNLRICNNQNNSRNKGVARSNTGYIGVSYNKRDDNYQSHIKVDYKKIYLGTHKSLESALISRLKGEKEYFGEFAPQRHLFEMYNI